MESNSRTNDDPLVSYHVIPVTIPIELVVPSLEHKENQIVLMDSGCTWCLVSPSVVEKLGVLLRELKVLMPFWQLDGSIAGGLLQCLSPSQ